MLCFKQWLVTYANGDGTRWLKVAAGRCWGKSRVAGKSCSRQLGQRFAPGPLSEANALCPSGRKHPYEYKISSSIMVACTWNKRNVILWIYLCSKEELEFGGVVSRFGVGRSVPPERTRKNILTRFSLPPKTSSKAQLKAIMSASGFFIFKDGASNWRLRFFV
jgi:hypothetical protein